jgi:ABC-type uncharacterized transport system permease subunit
VIVLASMGAMAFSSFLAVLVAERGGSAWLGGAAIRAFLVAGAATEFLAGNLSDRYGRKVVMLGSLALAAGSGLAIQHWIPADHGGNRETHTARRALDSVARSEEWCVPREAIGSVAHVPRARQAACRPTERHRGSV